MKHIKKLLALCLTLALVLSLAACGKQEEQPPETTPASYRIAALKRSEEHTSELQSRE